MGEPEVHVLGEQDILLLSVDTDAEMALVLGRPAAVSDLGSVTHALSPALTAKVTEHVGLAGRIGGAFAPEHGQWVKLTSESAARLRELGMSRDSAGQAMGVLRDANGQFAHVARFDLVAPMPFDPGTFVAALAIQQVVRQIEAKLEVIATDVQGLVQGARNELEAELASALDVLTRVERRVRDRGLVDDDDWATLATLEPVVKRAYHQTFTWLEPLRKFLQDGSRSIADQVHQLRSAHGLRDADFWLRMHVHSELALKRWELLYLVRESVVAPERLASEAEEVERRAAGRHEELVEMVRLLEMYLDEGNASARWIDRLRFVSRHRLLQLRHELAQVANAYAEGLRANQLEIPVYLDVEDPGPLIDFAEVQRFVRNDARKALEQTSRTAVSKFADARDGGFRSLDRLRAKLRSDDEADGES